jgi:hypothetical protein
MSISELRSLASFTVAVSYGRNETALDVRVTGQPEPVARLFKASQYDSRFPFQVLTGPQLSEVGGYVTPFAAFAANRAQLGKVKSRYRPLRAKSWEVEQPGLPVLSARPIGASSLRYRFPFSLLLADTLADSFLPFNFLFQGNESRGFVVSRATGIRARFTVTVHDPRVDRRLVLAAVVGLNRYASSDVRQDVVDLTANPFKG